MQGIIWLLFLTIVSIALGKRIYSIFRIRLFNTIEELIFALGIGFGILSYSVFILGLMKLLYSWVFYLLLVILLIFVMPEIKNLIKIRFQINMLSSFEVTLIILLVMHIIVNLIGSLAPVTSWDAVTYHLALPKVYFYNHKISNLPIHQSGFPANINMLYLLGLLINGEVLAKLINFLFSILVIFLIYSFCKKNFSAKVGLLAAIIYYATPVVNSTSSSLMIDQGLTFFLLLSLYAFYEYYTSGNKHFLILSAVYYGFALGCKYSLLIFAPLFLFVMALKVYKSKTYSLKSLSPIVSFSIISFIMFAPWLVKNSLFTGNPFYPFFGRFFPSKYLNPVPLELYYVHTLPTIFKRSFVNLLLLPWNLTMKGVWKEAIGPLFLIFIPFLFLLKNIPKVIKHILTFCFFYLILSFYSLLWVQKRYLLQIFPLFSIISAFVAYQLIDKDKILKYFIISFLLFCFSFNLILLSGQNYFKFTVVFGLETKDQYLTKRVPIYEAVKYLNLSKDIKKVLFLDPRTYYSDRPYLWGDPISQGLIDYSRFQNIKELLKKFNSLGISHILVYEPWLEKNKKTWASPLFVPLNKLYGKLKISEFFKLIYSKNETYVYEIRYPKNERYPSSI
jgi:hypothetical protein